MPPGAGSVNHQASCCLSVLASALCKVQFRERTSTGKQSARPLRTRRVDNSFLSKSLQVFQKSEHVDRMLNSKHVNDPAIAPMNGFWWRCSVHVIANRIFPPLDCSEMPPATRLTPLTEVSLSGPALINCQTVQAFS